MASYTGSDWGDYKWFVPSSGTGNSMIFNPDGSIQGAVHTESVSVTSLLQQMTEQIAALTKKIEGLEAEGRYAHIKIEGLKDKIKRLYYAGEE